MEVVVAERYYYYYYYSLYHYYRYTSPFAAAGALEIARAPLRCTVMEGAFKRCATYGCSPE